MNDQVVERLIQKVSAMLEEMSDINLLIRGLTPTQEVVNKLHERVESVQAAVMEMENVAQQNCGLLEGVQEQLKPLPEAIAAVKVSAASLQGELRRAFENESVLPRVVDDLRHTLQAHTSALRDPAEQRVKHHHHVHWSLIAACVLLAICVLLWNSLTRSWDRSDLHKAEDAKYRYLEVLQNAGLAKQLHWTDSAYIADPDKFEKAVQAEEEHQRHEWEAARQLEEDKARANQSQQQVKESEEEYRRAQQRR